MNVVVGGGKTHTFRNGAVSIVNARVVTDGGNVSIVDDTQRHSDVCQTIRGDDRVVAGVEYTIFGNRCQISGVSHKIYGNACTISGTGHDIIGNDNVVSGVGHHVRGRRNLCSGLAIVREEADVDPAVYSEGTPPPGKAQTKRDHKKGKKPKRRRLHDASDEDDIPGCLVLPEGADVDTDCPDMQCIICMQNKKQLAPRECGHLCMCFACAKAMLDRPNGEFICPVCMIVIKQKLQRIFVS
jgi:hypothetical protein